ncbi:hypothetical protein ILUMI_12377 [Ignelater luminosus]|uniref:Uncharacterized protein n=1 Tax=Ignelater luminosus TaxID=2038154 RepID=A0A8K0CZP0_IGNLU|nr:hypothetical protein ILUMI_12377 [Ignelater luminosus]
MANCNSSYIEFLQKSLAQLEQSDKKTSKETNATNATNNNCNVNGYQKPKNVVVENVPTVTPGPADVNNSLAVEGKDSQNQNVQAEAQAENFSSVEDLFALDLNPNDFRVCKTLSLETLQFIYDVKGSDTFDGLDV